MPSLEKEGGSRRSHKECKVGDLGIPIVEKNVPRLCKEIPGVCLSFFSLGNQIVTYRWGALKIRLSYDRSRHWKPRV